MIGRQEEKKKTRSIAVPGKVKVGEWRRGGGKQLLFVR